MLEPKEVILSEYLVTFTHYRYYPSMQMETRVIKAAAITKTFIHDLEKKLQEEFDCCCTIRSFTKLDEEI